MTIKLDEENADLVMKQGDDEDGYFFFMVWLSGKGAATMMSFMRGNNFPEVVHGEVADAVEQCSELKHEPDWRIERQSNAWETAWEGTDRMTFALMELMDTAKTNKGFGVKPTRFAIQVTYDPDAGGDRAEVRVEVKDDKVRALVWDKARLDADQEPLIITLCDAAP